MDLNLSSSLFEEYVRKGVHLAFVENKGRAFAENEDELYIRIFVRSQFILLSH